jgi:hypothetical protein
VDVDGAVALLHKLLVAVAKAHESEQAADNSVAIGQIQAVASVLHSRGLLSEVDSQFVVGAVTASPLTPHGTTLVEAAEAYMTNKAQEGAFGELVTAVMTVAARSSTHDEPAAAPDDATPASAGTDDEDWPPAPVFARLLELHDTVMERLVEDGEITSEAAGVLRRRLEAREPGIRAIWRVFLSTTDSADLRHSLAVYVAMMKMDESTATEEPRAPASPVPGTASDVGAAHQAALSKLVANGKLGDAQAAALAGMVGRGDPRALAALDGLASVGEDEVADALRMVADLAMRDSAFAQRYAMTSDEATE